MIVSSHCNPHSYIFTDLHHDVLSSLTTNLELNSFSVKSCDTHFTREDKYDITSLESSCKENKAKLLDQSFEMSTNTSNTNDGNTISGIISDVENKVCKRYEEISLKNSAGELQIPCCNLGLNGVKSSKINYLGCQNSQTNTSEVFVKQLDWTSATELELQDLKAGVILATGKFLI